MPTSDIRNTSLVPVTKKRLSRVEHLAAIQMTLLNLNYSAFVDSVGSYIQDYYTLEQIHNHCGYSETILKEFLAKRYVPELDPLSFILEAINIKIMTNIDFKTHPVKGLDVQTSRDMVKLITSASESNKEDKER